MYEDWRGIRLLSRTYYPNEPILPDYSPQTIDELVWTPSRDDNWYQGWYGLEVENGELRYVDCDSDGNWETDGTGEIACPSTYSREINRLCEQAEKASRSYAEHCLETGEDPLGVYFVKHQTKRNENYIAYATPWIGAPEHGMAVTSIRGAKSHLGGKTVIDPSEAPRHLSEFLGLKKVGDRYCMEDVKTREDICGSCVGCVGDHGPNGEIYIKFSVERSRPRRQSLIRADIRRIAQAALDRRSKRKAS